MLIFCRILSSFADFGIGTTPSSTYKNDKKKKQYLLEI